MPADIAELALACYRAPLAYQDRLAPSAPLPTGMDRLLILANGSGPTCDDAARRIGARPDEVRDAARFLVQRLCFGRGADHYRVLGLNPDAPPAQVKEHHRRLMWLFHPDRVVGRESWTEGYAARVNEAWAVLSHPESRACYDTRMRQPAPTAEPIGAWSAPRPLVPVGSGRSWAGRRFRQPRPVWRGWLPLAVLGGGAVGAVLLVGTIHLGLPSSAPRLYAPAAGSGTSPRPELSVQPAGLEHPRQRDPEPTQENGTGITLVESFPPAPPSANPSAPAGPAPVPQSTPEPIPTGVELTAREVQTLIDRYTDACRRGDLEGVMALFAADASGQGGSVRRDYGNLFAAFLIRRIQLNEVKWSLRGDRAKVSARYALWLRGRRDGQQIQWTGNIHFKLRKHEGQVMIDAIDYHWSSLARG